ncbi:jg2232 [Pararge aegeria aegeria]|uniref:Jg2232 protein n=1 Tax=Pararge aegeria aegeria TaxID=348720 RepID=A0A8S4SGL2_9NEOP|nr:jg2232 [Pararge aegeria aegeria]
MLCFIRKSLREEEKLLQMEEGATISLKVLVCEIAFLGLIITMNMQSPEEYSYLDEEPQQIMPYKLEVPILHMAIIDALGTRNQPESGDTGDVTSCTDSALISLTSLLDDDFVSTTDELADERFEETNSTRNRVLWDATEEGSNLDE